MHDCFQCGCACYCHGDIDDCQVETEEFAYANCDGCGCAEDEGLEDPTALDFEDEPLEERDSREGEWLDAMWKEQEDEP